MAVVDVLGYDNSTTSIKKSVAASGAQLLAINATVPVTSGDSITSVYRIAQVPSNYVPFTGMVTTAGIASMDDCDFGLYNTAADGGAVVDADLLADGVNLSGAVTIASPQNLFQTVTAANFGKTLAVLAGDLSSEFQTYDLAMTINAAAGATGSVNVRALLVCGA